MCKLRLIDWRKWAGLVIKLSDNGYAQGGGFENQVARSFLSFLAPFARLDSSNSNRDALHLTVTLWHLHAILHCVPTYEKALLAVILTDNAPES